MVRVHSMLSMRTIGKQLMMMILSKDPGGKRFYGFFTCVLIRRMYTSQ